MDFFTEQDQARKSTKLLVLLFSLAVLTLIVMTNIIFMVTVWLMDENLGGNYQAYQDAVETLSYQSSHGLLDYFSWQRFGLISLAVTGVIGCAMLFKWAQLSGGGKAVAEQLGGVRIVPNTDDANEKQMLNVVEEMAIASGMPVPSVYLLPHEVGINAFAAGSTPADAVIGVTRGCAEQFNREQLQGVIAHEFSHILNGDMRLNIRLIAMLHGILFIGLIGDMLVRGTSRRSYSSRAYSSRRSGDSRVAILGVALLIIGWLGSFFGSWIKSAVSRQREYLADASAVQFTRNPQGISDALKIIGGHSASTTIRSNKAGEVSHLFFGQALKSIFATHPPLEDRIKRIEPRWNGQFITTQPKSTTSKAEQTPSIDKTATAVTAAAAILANTDLDLAASAPGVASSPSLPALLIEQAHEPFSAMALLMSLLLSDNPAVQEKQLTYIKLSKVSGLSLQALQLFPDTKALPQALRLPLIEVALPALKCMSAEQYKVFCKTLLLLIRADNQFELFEWCLYHLVRHFLDAEFNNAKPSKPLYKKVTDVAKEYELVLSLLCHYGDSEGDELERAFGRGANSAGLYTISLQEKTDCGLDGFVTAVNKLACCYPLIKPKLLKGLADAARQNDSISATEKEMIHAIAAAMDSPVPIVLDNPLT